MFACKAGAFPKGTLENCFTLRQDLALLTYIGLCWKGLPGSNTLVPGPVIQNFFGRECCHIVISQGVRHFYPSITFSGKTAAYQSGAPQGTPLFWQAPTLARKYQTIVEVNCIVSYNDKATLTALYTFIVQAPGANPIQQFWSKYSLVFVSQTVLVHCKKLSTIMMRSSLKNTQENIL